MKQQNIVFDLELIKRYDKSGPRYTSYPTAVQFHDGFGEAEYRQHAAASNAAGGPLSLYFHIPFCDTVCFYCGCNKVATKDRSRASPYLQRVHRELELQSALFDSNRIVDQLHWGGGTPTFISHDEMRALMAKTRDCFKLHDDDSGEYSIEIDPREVKHDTIALLREIGFNRMSLGVQDFDERVQIAVNRIQSDAQTLGALEAARREGFKSISMDLIYGLPHQSVASFERTLERAIAIDADRLTVFNYAHLPEIFKPQRRINEADLPTPQVKLDILQMSIEKLTAAGYLYIGMDHFAKPDDELAVAQRDGTLYRNFQGYSTHSECDLVGLGATSIGMVGDSYAQNLKGLEEYYAAIDAGRLAIFRGVGLDRDDKLRRDVITRLICHFELELAAVERAHGIVFNDYFANELKDLAGMQSDGLLTLEGGRIVVQPAGKLLIRNICMVFDRYLREKQNQRFSRVI
jgi:oxygen-independent coproporphyrinogen-3 oxidase